MPNNKLQVSFLPWIGDKIEGSIKIGPITFWPYPAEANKRITDAGIKSQLDRLFRQFVDVEGKPVSKVIMCSYKDDTFHEFTLEEYYKLRDAVNILVFSAIASQTVSAVYDYPRGRTFPPPSSNAFELSTFVLNDDFILTSDGLWPIGNIVFHKPLSAGGKILSFDEDLIRGFDKSFSEKHAKSSKEEIRHLVRSLEWFRLAHTEDNTISYIDKAMNRKVSYPSKVVMMATAFEILFNFSENDHNKREKLAKSVENCISDRSSGNFVEETRLVPTRKARKREVKHTRPGWWAWDFYKLRDKVVHGDLILPSDLKYKGEINHLTVADLVFWECIKRELFKQECINDHVRIGKILLNKELKGPFTKLVTDLAKYDLEFEAVHDALGWLKEKEETNSS